MQTCRGELSSSWRVSDGGFELDLVIPPGTRADVVLPDGAAHAVEGGRHRFHSSPDPESKDQP